MSAVDNDVTERTSAADERVDAIMAGSGVALGADPRASETVNPSGRGARGNSSARSSDRWCSSLLFILLWEYFHRDGMRRFFDKPGFLLPSLATVFDQGFLDSVVRQQYITGIAWTTFAAVVGLSISIVLGIALAVVMAQARWMERSMYPYLVAAQALPVLAIVPLINSVFGGGMGARIFVCVMISIFPIVTNTLFGLTSVDISMHELFTLRGASRRTRLTKLQFPAALPVDLRRVPHRGRPQRDRRHRRRAVLPVGAEARHRRRRRTVPPEVALPPAVRRPDRGRRCSASPCSSSSACFASSSSAAGTTNPVRRRALQFPIHRSSPNSPIPASVNPLQGANMNKQRSASLLGLALAASLAVAACGSDSDDSSTTDAPADTTAGTTGRHDGGRRDTTADDGRDRGEWRGRQPRRRLPRDGRHPDRLDARGRARLPVPDGRRGLRDRRRQGLRHRPADRRRRQRHRRQDPDPLRRRGAELLARHPDHVRRRLA